MQESSWLRSEVVADDLTLYFGKYLKMLVFHTKERTQIEGLFNNPSKFLLFKEKYKNFPYPNNS